MTQDIERKYTVTMATLLSHTIILLFQCTLPIYDYVYQI